MSRRVVAIVAAALFLAVGMAVLGLLTARALRQRDRAVQDGVLLALARELQTEFREHGPETADAALATFLQRHSDAVAGVELVTPSGVAIRRGHMLGEPTDSPAPLGPAWRRLAGPGDGPRGFARGAGSPPFTLRLYPAEALGHSRGMATAVIAASSITAAALFLLAVLAGRGLLERERRLTAEAEQKRLKIAAVAGAGLAHRIRTPLATIKGTAQLLESQPQRAPERARRIVDEAARIDGMIRRLLEFARPPEPQPVRFDAAAAVREIAAGMTGVKISGENSAFVFADPVHFETALEELIANARAFDEGEIEVRVSSEQRGVAVEVRDHGPGLTVDPDQAFEPYFTTRADGTGLGLSIAHALIRSNRGDLLLRNAEGGGCTATIRLPEAS